MTQTADKLWWQESFDGKELPHDLYEVLFWTRWNDRDRKHEAELMRAKWWDERVLHPVAATYWFAHLYQDHTRLLIRRYIDDTPASVDELGRTQDWYPIKSGDVFKAPKGTIKRIESWERKIVGLIRARQAADEAGVPYGFYITATMDFFMRGPGSYMLDRYTLKVPSVNLLHNERARFYAIDRWINTVMIQTKIGQHDRYLIANFNKHPDQVDHIKWIVQQLEHRAKPELIASRLIKSGHLPQNVAETFFRARGREKDLANALAH
jgi:hypothetical protein